MRARIQEDARMVVHVVNFKGEAFSILPIIKWLDSQTISREKQSLRAIIPDGKAEHPAKVPNAVIAEIFVEMHKTLGVRAC